MVAGLTGNTLAGYYNGKFGEIRPNDFYGDKFDNRAITLYTSEWPNPCYVTHSLTIDGSKSNGVKPWAIVEYWPEQKVFTQYIRTDNDQTSGYRGLGLMNIYGMKDKEIPFYLVDLDKYPLNINYYDRPVESYEGIIKFEDTIYYDDSDMSEWYYTGFSRGLRIGSSNTTGSYTLGKMVKDDTCYGGQLYDIMHFENHAGTNTYVNLLRIMGMADVKDTLMVCIECLGGPALYKLVSNSGNMQTYTLEDGIVLDSITEYFKINSNGTDLIEKKIWIW